MSKALKRLYIQKQKLYMKHLKQKTAESEKTTKLQKLKSTKTTKIYLTS